MAQVSARRKSATSKLSSPGLSTRGKPARKSRPNVAIEREIFARMLRLAGAIEIAVEHSEFPKDLEDTRECLLNIAAELEGVIITEDGRAEEDKGRAEFDAFLAAKGIIVATKAGAAE